MPMAAWGHIKTISKGNAVNEKSDVRSKATPQKGIAYKWIALSNVTLASLMGMINGSIILISLPAIFKGIQILWPPTRSSIYCGFSWATA
jgi:hypothetical protein